jgi:tetratricopeptide (TPR) repeat protein
MSTFATAFKIIATFTVILLFSIQPNWLPLQKDFAIMREAQKTNTFTVEARNAIYDLYDRQPWNADRAEAAGLAALASKDYKGAQAALAKAASIKGWSPSLHQAMGDAYNGLGDRKQAINEWETALKSKLNDPSLLSKLANGYESEARYPEASAVLRTLVALQPTNALARYRFGVVLSVLDPAQAGSHLAVAAGSDPKIKPFAESLIKALNAGLDTKDNAITAGVVGYTLIGLREFKLAKLSLTRAIEQRPDQADAYAYLGLVEDRLGNDGTYAYEQALKIDPKSSLAHYLYGQHFRRGGKNDRAISEFKTAFDLDPSNPATSAELGSAYLDKGDLQNAEAWYAQAVRIAPQEAEFWILLAQFYLDNDVKVAEAGLPSAKRAVELEPNSSAANDALGHALYLTRKFKESESTLLTANALDPESARVYLHLGLLYIEMQRPSEAKAALNAAANLDAGGQIAALAFKALARLGVPSP